MLIAKKYNIAYSILFKKALYFFLSFFYLLDQILSKDLFQQIGKYNLNVSEIGAGVVLSYDKKTIQFNLNNLYETIYDFRSLPYMDIKSLTNHSLPNVNSLLFETEGFREATCDGLKCFGTNLRKGNLLNGASIEFQILFFKESGNITYPDNITRDIRKGSVKILLTIRDWGFCSNPFELMCQGLLNKTLYLATNYTITSSHKRVALGNDTYFLGDSYFYIGTNYKPNNTISDWEFLNTNYDLSALNSMVVFQKNTKPVTYINIFLRLNTPLIDLYEIQNPLTKDISVDINNINSYFQSGKIKASNQLLDGKISNFEISPQYIYELDVGANIIGYNKNIQGILLSDNYFNSNLNINQNIDSIQFEANSLSNFLKSGTSFTQKLQIFNSYSKFDTWKQYLVSPGDFILEVNIQNWPFCSQNSGAQNLDGCLNNFGNYNQGEYLDFEFLIKSINSNQIDNNDLFLTFSHNLSGEFSKPFIWIDNHENKTCKANQDCLIRVRFPIRDKPIQITLKFLFTIFNPVPSSITNYNYGIKNYNSFGSRKEGTEFYFTQAFYNFKINDIFYYPTLYFSLNSVVEKGKNRNSIMIPKHYIDNFSVIRAKSQSLSSFTTQSSGQEIKNVRVEYPSFLKKANLIMDFNFTSIDNIILLNDQSVIMKNTDILIKISITDWEFCSVFDRNCNMYSNDIGDGTFLELNFTLKYFNSSFVNRRDFNFNVNQNSINSIFVNFKDQNFFESNYSVLVPAYKNNSELQFLIETPITPGNPGIIIIIVILVTITVSIMINVIILKCKKQQISSSFIEKSENNGFMVSKI